VLTRILQREIVRYRKEMDQAYTSVDQATFKERILPVIKKYGKEDSQ
jgi:hypothetical protein